MKRIRRCPSLAVQPVSYVVDGARTDFASAKLGFLYGGGVRFRFEMGEAGKIVLLLRFEIIRYRRGWMNDTFLGFSFGAGF